MLANLVAQAKVLPGEIERLTLELASKKQALHELLALRSQREAEIAGEVANETNGDGKKRFPNEEARKAEIARRLAQDAWWQDSEKYLKEMRSELVELEARLERSRYEHRTATTLLNLLAAGIQAGNQAVIEAVLQEQERPQEDRKEQALANFINGLKGEIPQEQPPQEQEKQNGNGLKEAKVRVLEARPGKSEGTIRAWCETGDGEKVAVFGKNGAGKKLAGSVGEVINVRYKEGDYGWFAVKVG
ncbi:MAG: hypothetical protein HPY90_14990 [Syntrophothermus sp.]|uniref:hypothetical protein n=1 Tax=Syntrophothermus sp. TaxID=2736299 RepID=UPI00257FC51C|nr:hypothetical protein [Syntrophothermus sp.]NSW84515.1 hypothetical protein [Syntrophothermus sp.]